MSAADPPVATVEAIGDILLRRVEGFVEILRDAGVGVTVDETASAVEALECLRLGDEGALYWGLRMALVSSEAEIERFDRLFREYWLSMASPGPDVESEDDPEGRSVEIPPRGHRAAGADTVTPESTGAPGGPTTEPGDDDPDAAPAELAAYSAAERLRDKNFARYGDEDYRRLTEELEHLDLTGPQRRSRRYRAHRKGSLDIRRTIVAGFKTDGYPIRRHLHRRRLTIRPIVFVCDVSGSMQQYAMPVLLLARAMGRQRGGVTTFAFATRLHPIDSELGTENPKRAVVAVVERVVDWSGGTRVGECLETLNRDYASQLRGAVVVIASDGWDLGDVSALRAQMERLRLLSHEIIWLNPNLQDRAFEPLTKGMSSALPYVDHFISCHQYANFEILTMLLAESQYR